MTSGQGVGAFYNFPRPRLSHHSQQPTRASQHRILHRLGRFQEERALKPKLRISSAVVHWVPSLVPSKKSLGLHDRAVGAGVWRRQVRLAVSKTLYCIGTSSPAQAISVESHFYLYGCPAYCPSKAVRRTAQSQINRSRKNISNSVDRLFAQ
ncbi:hypothetical protein O181_037445 [Austropuccinia psidii MF-1]|uniref:Uncharacterized protein n=1 Tax=Austropuccinia psidii MF-1 TaxID=1389203 RepID=A0A9Q3D878_9BASI|nr:hypothetical protein [Austropuccinia psidii MF-1]